MSSMVHIKNYKNTNSVIPLLLINGQPADKSGNTSSASSTFSPSVRKRSEIFVTPVAAPKWKPKEPELVQVTDPTSFKRVGSIRSTVSAAATPVFRSANKNSIPTTETGENKRDSLSDAEGINALKKLLKRENSWQSDSNTSKSVAVGSSFTHGGIKKCPSVGSTTSNTSNWSSQPVFLQKHVNKSERTTEEFQPAAAEPTSLKIVNLTTKPDIVNTAGVENVEIDTGKDLDDQNILGLNVAQKANLFMKLEHEQRFSKWRKNSEDNSDCSPKLSENRRSASTSVNTATAATNRFSTQPVTNEEITQASLIGTIGKYETNVSSNNLITDAAQQQKQMPQQRYQTPQQEPQPVNRRKLSKNEDDDSTESGTGLAPGTPSSLSIKKNTSKIEPTCLSIKDRVQLFNRLSTTVPTTTINYNPMRSASNSQFGTKSQYGSSSGLDSSYDNLNNISSPKYRRRSSISDSTPSAAINNAIQQKQQQHQRSKAIPFDNTNNNKSDSRNNKSKSLFLAHSWEPEYLSEDGEVSSGGQEVSEIISKSYDNSPMFRKKNWKAQIPQPNLSKEIWKKFEKQSSNNTSDGDNNNEWVGKSSQYQPALSISSSAPNSNNIMKPSTSSSSSNLLPMLKILSSSDDQLDDYHNSNTSNIPATTIDSVSNQKDGLKSKRKYLKMRSEVCVRVPHPDDESFQKFFPKQATAEEESVYDNVEPNISPNKTSPAHLEQEGITDTTLGKQSTAEESEETSSKSEEISQIQLSSIKREGDLLTNMKKHIPIVRRKSSGKSSRNPMRTLAARFDSKKDNCNNESGNECSSKL